MSEPKATPTRSRPKQSNVYPPLKSWITKPENSIRLREILADPIFIAACHYATNIYQVTEKDLVGAQAALGEVIVRKAAMNAGATGFVRTLMDLLATNAPQTMVDEPWGWTSDSQQ